MSGEIRWRDQYVWVSNRAMIAVFDFGEEVGCATARDEIEESLGRSLKSRREQWFNGCDVDLETLFPLDQEKRLWARVFNDVARRIFLRKLGTNSLTFWQSDMIGIAQSIAKWLTTAVQLEEMGWHPDTENSREAAGSESRSQADGIDLPAAALPTDRNP